MSLSSPPPPPPPQAEFFILFYYGHRRVCGLSHSNKIDRTVIYSNGKVFLIRIVFEYCATGKDSLFQNMGFFFPPEGDEEGQPRFSVLRPQEPIRSDPNILLAPH